MHFTQIRRFKAVLVVAGVTLIAAAIGLATTAQLAARSGQGSGQTQMGPGGQRGQGMMGQMGPGGPGGRGGPGGGPMGMFGPVLRELNLTDAQHQQVQAIMESHRDDQKAIGDKMQAARKALQDAITADTFDEGAIRLKAAEVSAIDGDAAVLQAKIYGAVVAILAPEQVTKLKALRAEMEQRMKEGRGGMRPHHGPRPGPRPDACPDARPVPEAEHGVSLPETV